MQSFERDLSRVQFPIPNTTPLNHITDGKSLENVKLVPTLPSDAELVRNAKILLNSGEYQLGRNLLARGLQFYPKSQDLLILMAEVAEKLFEFDVALKCIEVLESFDGSPHLVLKYCDLLQKTGRHLDARAKYQNFLSTGAISESDQFFVYKEIGNLCVREGDYDGAEEFYNKAYALNSSSDALLVNYGTLEYQRGNYESALERFRDAISFNAQNANAWVGLALTHRFYGDLELSRANLFCALDHDPFHRLAIRLLAEWSIGVGDLPRVVERIDLFLEKYDQDFDFIFLSAQLNFLLGRYHKSIFDAEKACALKPEAEDAHVFLNLVSSQLKQLENRK